MEVRDRMRGARVMAGLSREKLAAQLGVSAETIRRRENGDVPVTTETLVALAQATGVPFAWLVEGWTSDQLNASMAEVVARSSFADDPPVLPDPEHLPGD